MRLVLECSYIDRMGTDKVLIIGFLWKGWDITGEVDRSEYGNYGVWMALNWFSDDKNVTSKLYYSSTFSPWSGVDSALQYIEENRKKFDRIVLLWHSIGADNAVELSEKLYMESIPVDLLITIDLQAFWDSTTVSSNVSTAINYYQDNWWDLNPQNIINPNWDLLNLAEWNWVTNLQNIDASSYCTFEKCPNPRWEQTFYHTDIDENLSDRVIRDIVSIIK